MLVCDICHGVVYLQYMEKHLIWHDWLSALASTVLRTGEATKEGMISNRDRLDVMDEDAKQAD